MLQIAATVPAPRRHLPRPIARLIARVVLAGDAHRRPPRTSLGELLPGIRHDFDVVAGVDGKMADFASLRSPVLVLSGTRSATHLRRSSRELAHIIPAGHLDELPGRDHGSAWNSRRGGAPETVAAALRRFFA